MLLATFSIFLLAQQSDWYGHFLKPVVAEVRTSVPRGRILDIGTGPGSLPKLLAPNPELHISGSDIDPEMITEARKNVTATNVDFFAQNGNKFDNIPDNSLDAVTICSVLFLLNEDINKALLDESLRMLKPGGKLIVLTPTGVETEDSALGRLGLSAFSNYNWTFYVWRMSTSRKAQAWQKRKGLSAYAARHGLKHETRRVFQELATLEIVTK